MRDKTETPVDRREFLKTVGRILGAGAIGLLGFRALLGKPGAEGAPGLAGQTCRSDLICARCAYVPGCGLPQALSYRRETTGT
jgi:hypothetical protein